MEHKELSQTDIEKIKKYIEEIRGNLENDSVDRLIESHRYLRSLNLEDRATRMESYREGFESGRETGMKSITDDLYIAVDKLKAMTMCELAQFLSEE